RGRGRFLVGQPLPGRESRPSLSDDEQRPDHEDGDPLPGRESRPSLSAYAVTGEQGIPGPVAGTRVPALVERAGPAASGSAPGPVAGTRVPALVERQHRTRRTGDLIPLPGRESRPSLSDGRPGAGRMEEQQP